MCEDYDLWLRFASKYPVHFLDQPLIKKYGGHSDQLSKVDDGIESYRIRSLKKIMNSGILNKKQKTITKDVLVKKMYIYAKGLEKRNKIRELNDTKKNIQYWINIT